MDLSQKYFVAVNGRNYTWYDLYHNNYSLFGLWNVVDREKYIVINQETDSDRCCYTWDTLYNQCYSSLDLWQAVSFEKRTRNSVYLDQFNIEISGDTFFNFKADNRKLPKYEYFKGVIEKSRCEENEKRVLLYILAICNLMTYSLHNFVLMPKTGGMNNFKARVKAYDRADTFLYDLADYYNTDKNIEHRIFSYGFGRNSKEHTKEENTKRIRKNLNEYLKSIGSKEKYCKYFLLIDDQDLIKELIENGKNTIDNRDEKAVENLYQYMDLALRFWIHRHNTIKTIFERE